MVLHTRLNSACVRLCLTVGFPSHTTRLHQERKKKENSDKLLAGEAKKQPLRTGFDPLPTEPGARIFQVRSSTLGGAADVALSGPVSPAA